ncbi:MAG: YabP/YqfC family sporulation protein [Lachnospiraceae bacterium]|nr:YabP/YqfC family sporulation protein [Lachnospiraceae bacterium]MCI7596629.1 YabP/YqfC family sporulation protein [Lachnospiraceae bacterium]
MRKRMADHKAQEKIVDCLELPKDILLGASIITALGNRELVIENYKGILDYQEECILLQGKHYRIQIKGKRLRIAYYTKEEMKICGCITEVAYQ